MNKLIGFLLAIQQFGGDIHYSCHGETFYADHIFVDKFNFDYIDDLKECCLLGKGEPTLPSKEYLAIAIQLIPDKTSDTNTNFILLQNLVADCLIHIQNMNGLTRADENLIGAISQDLQQYYGLLNLRNS